MASAGDMARHWSRGVVTRIERTIECDDAAEAEAIVAQAAAEGHEAYTVQRGRLWFVCVEHEPRQAELDLGVTDAAA